METRLEKNISKIAIKHREYDHKKINEIKQQIISNCIKNYKK